MAAKGNKLESSLVSMAGTLIYLQEMETTLTDKPIVPKSVVSHMARTQGELDMLKVQCKAVRLAAERDAAPLLEQWLEQVHLPVGGILTARTAPYYRGYSAGNTLMVRGGIERVRLHHYLVNAVRVVDITLVGAELELPDGRKLRTLSEIPVREQSSYNTLALRDYEHKHPDTGEVSRVLHIRVPIQAEQREKWARCNNLELS